MLMPMRLVPLTNFVKYWAYAARFAALLTMLPPSKYDGFVAAVPLLPLFVL